MPEPPAAPRSVEQSSIPDATRTTAPASLISIVGAVAAACEPSPAAAASATIGTKPGCHGPRRRSRARRTHPAAPARRQPNTCCGQTCQRRATSRHAAPGSSVSATIRAFSSADQRRRRPGPVRTSIRRKPPFASSLTSTITIARSPLPQANPPRLAQARKEGAGAPLTPSRHRFRARRSNCSTPPSHVSSRQPAERRRNPCYTAASRILPAQTSVLVTRGGTGRGIERPLPAATIQEDAAVGCRPRCSKSRGRCASLSRYIALPGP